MNELENLITLYNKRLDKLIENSVRYNYSINDYNKRKIKLLAVFDTYLLLLKEKVKKDRYYNNRQKVLNKINYILKQNYKESIRIKII